MINALRNPVNQEPFANVSISKAQGFGISMY